MISLRQFGVWIEDTVLPVTELFASTGDFAVSPYKIVFSWGYYDEEEGIEGIESLSHQLIDEPESNILRIFLVKEAKNISVNSKLPQLIFYLDSGRIMISSILKSSTKGITIQEITSLDQIGPSHIHLYLSNHYKKSNLPSNVQS